MKTSLDHLPKDKINEINEIVRIIKEAAPVEKIILFGVYAGGDWVSDKNKEGHPAFEYFNEYYILVIVRTEKLQNDVALWREVKQQILKHPDIYTTVNLIVDTLQFVNQKFSEGNYIYADIKNEGILLYSHGGVPLADLKIPDSSERRDIMKKDLDLWTTKASKCIEDYEHSIQNGKFRDAVFQLSLAVESLYYAVISVYTGYTPKSHSLEKIDNLVVQLIPEVEEVFPKNTEEQKFLYGALVKACAEGKHGQEFQISKDQLAKLYRQIKALEKIVVTECRGRIDTVV